MALTIGIDARAATEVPAGRGRVVRELLRALAARDDAHRYLCYARERWSVPLDARFQWRLSGARDPLWHLLETHRANRECDVFLATNSYLTAMLSRIPTVAIIYDLVAFDAAMAPNRRSTVIERLTLGGAVRRASRLLCISRTTADALIARYPEARTRTVVAPLGVAPTLDAPAPAEVALLPPPGFVLAVGTLEPRKNLPRLVEAFARLPPELQAVHPLVVVGATGWSVGPTVSALAALGDRCVRLGHVSDATLAELYRRCGLFCYPSLGEGFGLPVLEAMAAGAPVLTSSVSSLPEIAGDGACFADPKDVEAISRAMETLLTDVDRARSIARRGQARAGEFSWGAFAARTLATLDAAAAS
ncbi:MAG: glycosyltransferase family 4 protein [Actinomycetota bacterium]|nr:glycosyltransferase family 4 protein [Actinomycetota bacterium]